MQQETRMVVQVELDKLKFFARPRLGLDCVGGASTLRLSDALAQVILACFCWTYVFMADVFVTPHACMPSLHQVSAYK